MTLTVAFCIFLLCSGAYARKVSPEEFANALRNNDVPENQIKTWQCIAQHESEYETSAHNTGSGDHGILQISQIYWCSPPGNGCGVDCRLMRDDDIDNDIKCALTVFRETQKFSGNGFTAWTVYPKCRNL